jgi:hypothetical protein
MVTQHCFKVLTRLEHIASPGGHLPQNGLRFGAEVFVQHVLVRRDH